MTVIDNCELEVVKRAKTPDGEPEPPPRATSDLIYSIEDVPPWYECLIYGFQHYVTMPGSTIANPIVLATFLCLEEDNPARGALVSSIIFMSGVITLLQSTFGVRLPIIQGGNFAYLVPTIVLLTTNHQACSSLPLANMTMAEKEEVWQVRMREVQGAITISSIFQVLIGFTGVVGLVMRWITPLTVMATVTLVGLSLCDVASMQASGHWGICLLMVGLALVFSQHLGNVFLPFPVYSRERGISYTKCRPFKSLSLLLAVMITWLVCVLLTAYDLLPEGSSARTDMTVPLHPLGPLSLPRYVYVPRLYKHCGVLSAITLLFIIKWGLPTVNFAGTVGLMAAVLASIIESVGDYYACARVVDAPLPPTHAINRGIGMEGIGCMLAGLWGTGSGTTSYSGNIGILSITKVGSRRVVQYAGLIMIVCGVLAKLGAVFVSIPKPVIAGVVYIKFAMVTAVGLANLQYVDLTSSRNLFIIGFSLFVGLSVPKWLESNPSFIESGVMILDQTIAVLLQTSMFLGGFLAFLLDNTIPGTDDERGVRKWRGQMTQTSPDDHNTSTCYKLPLSSQILTRTKWLRYVPFCSTFEGFPSCKTLRGSTR